jgi:hypothetical protein
MSGVNSKYQASVAQPFLNRRWEGRLGQKNSMIPNAEANKQAATVSFVAK